MKRKILTVSVLILKICDDNKIDSDAMILIKMFRSNVLGQLQFHEL